MRNSFFLKLYTFLSRFFHFFFDKEKIKLLFEFLYWQIKKWQEKDFTNHHYKEFFTKHFRLSEEFYTGKKILDIGCGPRGSLEWAANAQERVGLDPLAEKYLKLNQKKHKMTYVKGFSEQIPFENDYFDIISSFNSLDHVQNINKTLTEIHRCLKKNGLFLLISDIHTRATLTEPSAFGWEISQQIEQNFQIVNEKHYEGNRLYKSIRKAVAFDHSNPKLRYGVLSILAQKKEPKKE